MRWNSFWGGRSRPHAAGEEREHVTVRERDGIQEVHENATSKPPMRLVVHKQLKGDVYRDIVRITENYRRDSQDRLVPEGTVVKLIVSNGASRTVFVWLRGMKGVEGETEPWIRMDDKTRNDLGVDRGQKYDFRIERVNICGRLRWALGSSDPALRVAVPARCGLGGSGRARSCRRYCLHLLQMRHVTHRATVDVAPHAQRLRYSPLD